LRYYVLCVTTVLYDTLMCLQFTKDHIKDFRADVFKFYNELTTEGPGTVGRDLTKGTHIQQHSRYDLHAWLSVSDMLCLFFLL